MSAALLLSACAGYSPNNGMVGSSREQLIQVMGKPAIEVATPNGRIMQYPRGPFGKHTYFVYLDQNDILVSWTQVLDEKNFALIQPGMHRDDVIAIIGESRVSNGIAFGRGYVWSWRYANFHCTWFRAEFTPDHIVRSTMYQKPPECSIRR
jgi:hypothetical protein